MVIKLTMYSQIILLALVSSTFAQTCITGTDVGPCTTPCPSGTQCDAGRANCCVLNNSTTSTSCVDKTNPRTGVSDCPARSNLCNDSVYYDLMTVQCPRTCNRCGVASSTTTSSTTTCVDLTGPSGVSDCARRANLCNDATYRTLMRQQCPRTCGFC
ncbi:unnamed protein product [Auanema sp. JU1783]|nr:unnamed protein product [Auanema sp. JU1783]